MKNINEAELRNAARFCCDAPDNKPGKYAIGIQNNVLMAGIWIIDKTHRYCGIWKNNGVQSKIFGLSLCPKSTIASKIYCDLADIFDNIPGTGK